LITCALLAFYFSAAVIQNMGWPIFVEKLASIQTAGIEQCTEVERRNKEVRESDCLLLK
jgi:hypothetical protein